MPPLTNREQIRAILRCDPVWGVYALGDLSPAMFPKAAWFTPDLSMVLTDYGTCILFAMGTASIGEALAHVTWPVHLQVRPDALDEVARHAVVTASREMVRMAWNHVPPPDSAIAVARLTAADVPTLLTLYKDGESCEESPEFFFPSMVTSGVFFGVFEDEALIAAAGTHLVSRDEGAAAIGNVYTRRDRRGRGLSRAAMTAVLRDLADVETVGLNVRADNAVAIRVYESLGFRPHCEFREAIATGWNNR